MRDPVPSLQTSSHPFLPPSLPCPFHPRLDSPPSTYPITAPAHVDIDEGVFGLGEGREEEGGEEEEGEGGWVAGEASENHASAVRHHGSFGPGLGVECCVMSLCLCEV
jgi:hypothetical protein